METEYECAKNRLNEIAKLIVCSGGDPLTQLTGYATTGDPRFVTRSGGAREAVQKISQSCVLLYVLKLKAQKLADCE